MRGTIAPRTRSTTGDVEKDEGAVTSAGANRGEDHTFWLAAGGWRLAECGALIRPAGVAIKAKRSTVQTDSRNSRKPHPHAYPHRRSRALSPGAPQLCAIINSDERSHGRHGIRAPGARTGPARRGRRRGARRRGARRRRGAPVLDEFGRLVGVVSAGLFPGADSAVVRMADFTATSSTGAGPLLRRIWSSR